MPELASAWVKLAGDTRVLESDIKGALNRVDGAGAGRKVGEQFSKSVAASTQRASSGIRASLNEMVSGITSQFGAAGKAADSVFQSIPSKAAIGAGAVLGIGAAALTVGKQLYDLGAQWDDVVDTAAGRTGLLGDSLKSLTDSIKETANVTASSIPEIGDIASRVTQSLHLTGQPLQEMTKNIADLNALTGETLNVRELGKAYREFGVDVRDQVPELDALWNASTATGIPINELIATISKGGPALKEFGLDIGQSAALVATFEDAGLDASGAVGGLRIALKNFAKAGEEPQQALRNTITEIKNLSDAGNTAGAVDLAAKTFGKGFAPFLDAIKSGKVDVDSLNQSLRQIGPNTAPSIAQARDATSDWQEQLTTLKNQLSTELEPAASATFSAISGLITVYLINPLKQANDLVGSLANFNPQGPSGPAVLGPDGKPVSAPAPAPAGNPLDALSSAPSGSAQRPGQNPLDVLFPVRRRAGGGSIFGRGGPTSDIIPIWASNGEHMLSASDVKAMGGQGGVYAFRNMLHRSGGGRVFPLAVPWGVDPHGSRDPGGDSSSSAGPFGPWWDMDWLPPENPQRVGPSLPGVQGKWWHRGPTDPPGKSGKWSFPPIGKHRKPKPGEQIPDYLRPPGEKFIPWGFAGGGAIGYGLSSGSNSGGYGGTGTQFPDWVYQIADYFGVKPSTYPGHQTTNRNESGYAPNPQGLNRGIDWSGPPQNMQRFADYLATIPQDLEQVIWNGPGAGTGDTVEIAGGRAQPGYFAGDLGGHSSHVHTRQSSPIPLPGQAADALTQAGASTGLDLTRLYADSLSQGGQDAAQQVQESGSPGGPDASSLGQSLVSGLLQGLGLDGSVFSNPLEWPNVKSGMALANWGGGLLKNFLHNTSGEEGDSTDLTGGVAGGSLSSIGLPSLTDFIKPIGPGPATPFSTSPNAPHAGSGATPGPAVVVNGNVGMDPRAFTQRVEGAQNQAWRKNMSAVRPAG